MAYSYWERRKPYRLDVSGTKDDLLTFVNEDTPLRNFNIKRPPDIQAIRPVEGNLKHEKLPVLSIHKPPDPNLDTFLNSMMSLLDHYPKVYEDFIISGDFSDFLASNYDCEGT